MVDNTSSAMSSFPENSLATEVTRIGLLELGFKFMRVSSVSVEAGVTYNVRR